MVPFMLRTQVTECAYFRQANCSIRTLPSKECLMNTTDRQTLGRRDFMKSGIGGALASTMGSSALFGQGVPAWEARPANIKSIRPISIDMHTHWFPETYVKATVEMGRPAPANPYPLDSHLDQRCKWMDEHGVQMHVLTLSGAMPWQWATPDQGDRLAQISNDAAVEAHNAHPDRFVAGIELPIRDAGMALKELNRMAGKPGMRAVHLPNSIEQRDYLFEPEFAPVLARCEELGYPLLFHPLDGEDNIYAGKERLGSPLALSANINNTLGFTFESATTAAKFIITGTLVKFPNLEIVLPHSCGCFPSIAGRRSAGPVV